MLNRAATQPQAAGLLDDLPAVIPLPGDGQQQFAIVHSDATPVRIIGDLGQSLLGQRLGLV